MQTKVTLEEGIASQIERISRERQASFQEVLNQALREGLARLEAPRNPSRTKPVDLGGCLLESLDDTAAALAQGEGDRAFPAFRV